MKKHSFLPGVIIGLICGLMVGGATAAAVTSLTATPRTTTVKIDGKVSDIEGYIIEGRHYFQLREMSEALEPGGKDFAIIWDGPNNTAIIDTSRGYTPDETPAIEQVAGIRYTKGQTIADGSGSISDTKLTTKVMDGKDMSREDFSQKANPAVFDDVFTRAAYNTVRQSVLDRAAIVKDADSEKAINPYYSYASVTATEDTEKEMKWVMYSIGIYHRYEIGAEPYRSGPSYLYPNYFICKVSNPSVFDEAIKATEDFVKQTKALSNDAEKVRAVNDLVCDSLTYNKSKVTTPVTAFTSTTPSEGACGSYSQCFTFLCDLVGIPCIEVSGDNHAWNVVYAGGKWSYVDCVANDVGDELASRDAVLMADSVRRNDYRPKVTKFAQEVLVPNSTK